MQRETCKDGFWRLVPVIGGLNLYVVPHGAGCSDLLQCLPDVWFSDRQVSRVEEGLFSRVKTCYFVGLEGGWPFEACARLRRQGFAFQCWQPRTGLLSSGTVRLGSKVDFWKQVIKPVSPCGIQTESMLEGDETELMNPSTLA